MNANVWIDNFWLFTVAAALIFICGIYCLIASRNLIRILIGMELLTKSVTLLLVLAGAVTGRMAQVQTLIITLIVLEVVGISIAAGIVVGAFRQNGTIDAKSLSKLNG